MKIKENKTQDGGVVMITDGETETPEITNKQSTIRQMWPHLLVTLVLMVLFIFTGSAAWNLGLGSFSSPAPGLWPFLAAAIGLGLSAFLAIGVFLGIYDRNAELFGDVEWFPTATFVVAVVGFLVLYPFVGFLPAAIPMAFVLTKYAAGAPWISAIVTSLVAPVILYYVFREVLNVRF